MKVSSSETIINNFEKERSHSQITNKVKNPFSEILNTVRSSDLILSFDSQFNYEDFVRKINFNVQQICQYIKSI